MSNSKFSKKSEKGFTLIELLVVAAIIGILLAIAIPNLIKARISANEANARKSMQTLRDAEGEFFEQDLDNDGARDYTNEIGTIAGCTDPAISCLRDPEASGDEVDALIDSSFESAEPAAGNAVNCPDPKAGYCLQFDPDDPTLIPNGAGTGYDDFGWQASMTSWNKVGRKDYAVYGDGAIRCIISGSADPTDPQSGTGLTAGAAGEYTADRTSPGCD